MQTLPSVPSIFDYTDYREYLRDFYAQQKRTKSAFSYRYFSNKAGINSVGLYKDVIEGRQSLGRSLVVKFSKALGHSKRQAEYFENMVYFCEAKTLDERKLFFERMLACCEASSVVIVSGKFEYYSHWHYSAVRALISFYAFSGDYAALGKQLMPPISADEVRRAIELLLRLGFIEKCEDGTCSLVNSSIATGRLSGDKKVESMNVMRFQRAMVDLGKEAYDRHPTSLLDMSTLTLSVSAKTYTAMKEEVAALRKKLLLMAENDTSPDRVYHSLVLNSHYTKLELCPGLLQLF